METFLVTPYPKPVHLRDGGLSVLRQMGTLPARVEICGRDEFFRYIYTPDNRAAGQLEIGALFFIERTEAINRVTPLPVMEAMQMLMKGPIAQRKVDGAYLRFLGELSKRRCHLLQYGSMDFVRDWIEGDGLDG